MQFGSVAEFAEALTELRVRAGLTVRDVARATDIPSATLGGYFSGRHLPPRTRPEVLRSVLLVLGVPEDELDGWAEALAHLRPAPGRRRGAAPYRGLEPYGVEDAEWYTAGTTW